MQIVIDIDEEDLRLIELHQPCELTEEYLETIFMKIENGTPLPKGHGRLIDADVLREEVYSWGMNDYEPSDFTDAIDDAPTIEVISKSDYKARLKADMVTILDKIRAEINRQEKWLLQAGYNAYNVDIVFDAIKSVVEESEGT